MKPTDRATTPPPTAVAPEVTLAVADHYALDDVLDRLWLLAGETVRLAVPAGSSLFLTATEFRQLREIVDHQEIGLTLETEDPLRVQLAGMFGLPAVRVGGPLGPRRLPPAAPPSGSTDAPARPDVVRSVNGVGPAPHHQIGSNGSARQTGAAEALPDLPTNDDDPLGPAGTWTGPIEPDEGPRFREPGQPFVLRPAADRLPLPIPTRAPAPPPPPEPVKLISQPVVAPPVVEVGPSIATGGAGTGRFEALRTAAERRAARDRNPNLGRPALVLLAGAAAVLVLGFLALFVVLPRATVTLQLREQTVVAETVFLVLPPDEEIDPEVPAVVGQPQTVELAYTATVETTGMATIGDQPARGEVRLANPTDQPVTIAAGTVGTGDTGLQFRVTREVTVPAAANGVAGQTDAVVEMVVPGTAGNLAVGELSGRLDSGVYLSNRITALSGGTDIATRGVAQSDLDALQDRFEEDQRGLAEARFAESLPAGTAVAASSFAFTEATISFDHTVGEPAATVTLIANLAVTGLTFDAAEVMNTARPLLETDLQRQVPAGYTLDPAAVTLSTPQSPIAAAADEITVVVTASGRAVYRLDEPERAALSDRLAGLGGGDAEAILATLPAIESSTVDYFPGLFDRMPSRSSRIEIVVRE